MNSFTEEVRIRARQRGRPLLAFNIVDWPSLSGVLDAAQVMQDRVVTQFSSRVVEFYGPDVIVALVRGKARDERGLAFLHLDHCRDDALLASALAAGFDGVMADGSHLPLEQNIEWTAHWVTRAREYGALIEGELSAIRGEEDGIRGSEGRQMVSVEEFTRFAASTQVDLLGTDIGTSHGLYSEQPSINQAFLESLGAVGCRAGWVVHGGSGLEPEALAMLSDLGAAKVNFSTDLKVAWWKGLEEAGRTHPPQPLLGLGSARAATREMALSKWQALLPGEPG